MTQYLNALNAILFAAAVVISAAAVYNFYANVNAATDGTKSMPRLKAETLKLSDRQLKLLLLFALAVGIGVRVWRFGLVPAGVNQDGAMAAVDGKALAEYGTDRYGTWVPAHLYAWGYGQMSSLLSYMIAAFVKFWGFSIITARMPQLVASIIGGVFFCLFMKDTFGNSAGVIAGLFVAIDPWHFVQSRWALDCNLLPHFFMGGIYFLNKGLLAQSKKQKGYIYLSMVFFALCMYCYGITIYTIPVFLLAAGLFFIAKKILTLKQLLVSAAIYLLIAWPFILTMAVNYFKWDTIELPFVTIQYFEGSVRAGDILLFSEHPLQQLLQNIRSLLNTTVLQKKDLPWNDIEGFGTLYLFTMPFVAIGIFAFFKMQAKPTKALAPLALLTGVWVGLLTNNVNVNRINIVYYGFMMFAVLGICFVVSQIKGAFIITGSMYFMMAVLLFNTYFTTYASEIAVSFYSGFGSALQAAEESGSQRIYVTADAQGTGYWQTSEILTLFYDKTDAEYFQGKTNSQHGQELWPYNQRFVYVSMSEEVAEQTVQEDAAYVIREADKVYFDSDIYEIKQFDGYCAVIKRSGG